MSITKWNPRRSELWSPFSERERFLDYFGPFFSPERIVRGKGYWHPAVDVFENNDYVMVKADLPGFEEKDIHVTFDGHILTLEGERKEEHPYVESDYYSRERFEGKFHRVVHLPSTVSNEGMKARYHHGVLKIQIQKKERLWSKEIEVEMEA